MCIIYRRNLVAHIKLPIETCYIAKHAVPSMIEMGSTYKFVFYITIEYFVAILILINFI